MDRRIWIGVGVLVALAVLKRKELSQLALSAANSFAEGGGYQLGGTGIPFDIVFDGKVIIAKDSQWFCSGFTFATVMEAARRAGLLKGKSAAQVKKFQQEWYGSSSSPSTVEQQAGPAMANLGVGGPIDAAQAKPGDFAQFWRTNNTGHSVVFLGWLKDASGKVVGIRYKSAQTKTNGVGVTEEKFSDAGGAVLKARTYFSRLKGA